MRRSWNDGKTQTLETLFDGFVDGLEAQIVTKRLRREERERTEAEYREMERRRGLAKARCDREHERIRFLNRIMHTERQVARIRMWLATYEQAIENGNHTALSRMIEWARAQLFALEASLDTEALTEELRIRILFPEIDELSDPLGDPPVEQQHWS